MRVRDLGPVLIAGPTQVEWDGTDDAGHAVPAGMYFARSGYAKGGFQTSRIVIIR